MLGFEDSSRAVLTVEGPDAESFLQGLVTIDVAALGSNLGYCALLTPQGKFLFDFFVQRLGEGFRLDVSRDRADALVQRLSMYKLRAKVEITPSDEAVFVTEDGLPGQTDPRDARLGARYYGDAPDGYQESLEHADVYDTLLVACGVPSTGRELIADETYILEAGLERLGGVDFSKGCYVGQEVTARMRHKTELRKGLVQVRVPSGVSAGAPLQAMDGREAGQLLSVAGDLGLAHLRIDRAKEGVMADGIPLEVLTPVWEMPRHA